MVNEYIYLYCKINNDLKTDIMKTTLTFSNRELAGEYKSTLIDDVKKASNRLTSICGRYYTVITSNNEMLEFVGKRNFNNWAKNNHYVTDF